MVALTQQEKTVVDLFRSLQPARRRQVLLEMARTNPDAWKGFQARGEEKMRELARREKLDWDGMDDQQRQDFVERQFDGEGSSGLKYFRPLTH